MGPWTKLPEWAQAMEESLREGESALSILHGQVYDYTRVNGDYLPFRHFLAQWLGQERHVVFYNLGLGLEFGDAAGENAFREALVSRMLAVVMNSTFDKSNGTSR